MRAILIFTSLLVATAAGAQTTYVWQLRCGDDFSPPYASYSLPEQCTATRGQIAETCERPLLGPNQPNPAFVRIADMCKDALNGRLCRCEYRAVQARSGPSVLDVWNTLAPRGPIKVGP